MEPKIADLSEWPIVKITMPHHVDAAFIDRMYDEVDLLLDRGPHIEWVDLRGIDALRLPATVRQRAAEHERALIAKARGRVLADVRLVDGALQRGLLTAFEWLAGTAPWPVSTVAGPDEAYAWLRKLGVLEGSRPT